MKFLDQARVYVRSGDGGAGSVSFRREKFIEFGGPDGGDGGRGGDVVVECADGLNTLIDFRYQQHFKAKTGIHGMGRNRAGGRGADAALKVPVGTQVIDEESGALLADLTQPGQRVVVAKGGNGGFGNAHFTTSTNRAPRRANPGQSGIERTLVLRLKLIADAGLIGLPNAGKSTFLAAVSAAKPKIADYPFTTLHPGLGVVKIDGRDFVLADIPGLIEGAHEGHGLGDRFLGHVERCGALAHLIDATGANAGADYRTVRRELVGLRRGARRKGRDRRTVQGRRGGRGDAREADRAAETGDAQLRAAAGPWGKASEAAHAIDRDPRRRDRGLARDNDGDQGAARTRVRGERRQPGAMGALRSRRRALPKALAGPYCLHANDRRAGGRGCRREAMQELLWPTTNRRLRARRPNS